MKQLGTRLAVKVLAFLLALGTGVGGVWASLFIFSQWDTLWTGVGYYSSNSCFQNMSIWYNQVAELARLLQYQDWDAKLSYLDEQRLSGLEYKLDNSRTNFRFSIRRNDTGTLIYANGSSEIPMDQQVHAVSREAMAPRVTVFPPMEQVKASSLRTVSVVMMASAASPEPSGDRAAAASGMPFPMAAMFSSWPMTPVEATTKSLAFRPVAWAASWHISSACSWLLGAQALALPEFTTTAWASPFSRWSMVT